MRPGLLCYAHFYPAKIFNLFFIFGLDTYLQVCKRYGNIPITCVIGTKFLSEQVAKYLVNTREREQNVPIKICLYWEITQDQRLGIQKMFL